MKEGGFGFEKGGGVGAHRLGWGLHGGALFERGRFSGFCRGGFVGGLVFCGGFGVFWRLGFLWVEWALAGGEGEALKGV